jgi:hypothetical protein
MKDDLKKVATEVSKECLKKLKIVSIQKEISLADCVRDILERSVKNKSFENQLVEER